MARRPAPSARSARGPGREAGGSGAGPEAVDPRERLAALLARGYGAPAPDVERGDEGSDEGDDGWADLLEDGEGSGPDDGPGPAGRRARGGGRHRPARAPAVWSLPSSLVDARRAVSWRAVLAVALLVVAAGAVFAVRVTSARASAQPQTVASDPVHRSGAPSAFAGVTAATGAGGGDRSATATATGPGASGSAVPTTGAAVVVDVAGQVLRPGVVSLPAGARVADALARAGVRDGADLAVLNLARPLVDGERLYVPRPGEAPPTVLGPVVGGSSGAGAGSGGGASGGSGSGGAGASGGPVDLNTADLVALDGLPGVGPVLAQRILDWRTQHGRFSSVDELGEVSGIGDKLLGTLRPLVTV